MEKAYTAMKNSGVGNIVVGIVILTLGITAGVLSIISGAILLKNKKEITFQQDKMMLGSKAPTYEQAHVGLDLLTLASLN